nr:phosphoglycerate mutase family protein [uncultured Anaerotignum sp.]
MRLYLVRHGQTDMNKRNMFYGWMRISTKRVYSRQSSCGSISGRFLLMPFTAVI